MNTPTKTEVINDIAADIDEHGKGVVLNNPRRLYDVFEHHLMHDSDDEALRAMILNVFSKFTTLEWQGMFDEISRSFKEQPMQAVNLESPDFLKFQFVYTVLDSLGLEHDFSGDLKGVAEPLAAILREKLGFVPEAERKTLRTARIITYPNNKGSARNE